jgi:hypothetical protein
VLTAAGRRSRLAGAAMTFALLAAGTAWGSDDHFPFGPFRMYATATKPTGRVAVADLVGTTTTGRTVELDADDVGLRRAELEGQLPRARRDPAVLGALVDAYEARRPGADPLLRLRLVSRGIRLVDGHAGDAEDERVLATWERQ